MNAVDGLELTRDALRVVLMISTPVVLAVMLVGIVVSLLQALTQVQEMTLTFVPKIVVALGVLIVASPFIGGAIATFAHQTYSRIEMVEQTRDGRR